MNLPCPQCGSTNTLGQLQRKLAEVKDRLAKQARKRYPSKPKPISGGGGRTLILPDQIMGRTNSSITLGSLVDDHFSGDLQIGAPDYSVNDVGTITINDAVLDTCVDCGAFYAANAKALGDSIQKEIFDLDPLGALAEILDPEEQVSG